MEERRNFTLQLYQATRLTNNINSSRKLKVTWLILGRSHTRLISFQLQPLILAQKATWARKVRIPGKMIFAVLELWMSPLGLQSYT